MGDKASVFKTDLGVIRNVHLGLSDKRAPESQYDLKICAMISLIFKRCKVILTTKTLTIVVQENLQLQNWHVALPHSFSTSPSS